MAPKRPSTAVADTPVGDSKKLKQGNLFSFFSKKPPKAAATTTTTSPAAAKTTTTSPAAAASSKVSPTAAAAKSQPKKALVVDKNKQKKKNQDDDDDDMAMLPMHTRLQVYWPDDDAYYTARVEKQRGNTSFYYLHYEEDDQCEWVDLKQETYKLLTSSNKNNAKRRRQIQESDDEGEAEFDMADNDDDGDDDESDYQAPAAADDDDEEDDWLVADDHDDDDDDQETPVRPRKRVIVTAVGKTPSRPTARPISATTTPKRVTPGSTSSSSRQSVSSTTPSSHRQPLPAVHTPRAVSHDTTTATPNNSRSSNTSIMDTKEPIPFVVGALNPAGSHVHNHLGFLRRPVDCEGKSPQDPAYHHRTLRVQARDWERVTGGKKMTDAVQQWWDLKAQYFDTVLLFKTGKFYEMFHMDADIGVQVLGLSYMRGHQAHAGFPEAAYGTNADKLALAGYKVARVEQTETPADLAIRKQKRRKGTPAPKVVNREVCSILTVGTRTFCYLDPDMDPSSPKQASSVGPLLAIREIVVSASPDNDNMEEDEDGVQPVCEYGITLVDAVNGTVTVGQFADDVLRSRMNTLLTAYCPSEILLEGGDNGASPTLHSLIRSFKNTSQPNVRIETVKSVESFPKSTALDPEIRRQMERGTGQRISTVQPWDVQETLQELHRREYYPRASKKETGTPSVSRWPPVLKAAVQGEADLALSSFGAVLYYLQRNLIDAELLSMGVVKAYIPPASSVMAAPQGSEVSFADQQNAPTDLESPVSPVPATLSLENLDALMTMEAQTNHLSLDGTTLHNLEILTNSVDYKVHGSLWSKINSTKTPHGSRLLRAWLLRPLFRKADIDRRTDAVEELVSGGPAVALAEATQILSKCGDLERLLSRVHSMSGVTTSRNDEEDDDALSTTTGYTSSYHPNDRAVLYETATYTKRKVGDFSKVLNGLKTATLVPELFDGVHIQSGLLRKIVCHADKGGCFPDMVTELDWFFDNFDCEQAAKGHFDPTEGIDDAYDAACATIRRIENDLDQYKREMCAHELRPQAKSVWKYINIKPESKDKYLIELPASIPVPQDFIMKGQRGSGAKQFNKYRTSFVEELVQELEQALDVQKERRARGLQLIFARFDAKRSLWAAAAQTTAMLDALGSLARTASKPGYSRSKILDCPPNQSPTIKVVQGRHPCVENSAGSTDFVPNDLVLGSSGAESTPNRILLLSGPNMGGKSTLLRQTCLIAILAQIGSFVPAAECELTPVDCIYTRLGASDRILLGQSTFFVELAETAAALRGATRRSLVIMDELGRGTSTFDGTAIAHASVKHLVERSQCLSLFATHYHSLLDEWKEKPHVRLGHMECFVDNSDAKSQPGEAMEDCKITFLYTLGDGVCPKSFGINVARLAGLPEEVLVNAKRISSEFEQELSSKKERPACSGGVAEQKQMILKAIEDSNWEEVHRMWQSLQVS